ncbi:LiaF transmembrane domain-containing protein [Pedobacter sp.]|uniref:LiaF transmembrane domain-containing protein n=1 Tax=Pedobacter sp. TaxID=1411316 RepID=UPI003D7F74F7
METLNNNKTKTYFILGVSFLAVGLLSLASNLGFWMPFWVFNWSTIILGIGLLLGYRKDFKAGAWMILVFIGGLNFLQNILAVSLTPHMFALFCVGLGIYLLVKPGKRRNCFDKKPHHGAE